MRRLLPYVLLTTMLVLALVPLTSVAGLPTWTQVLLQVAVAAMAVWLAGRTGRLRPGTVLLIQCVIVLVMDVVTVCLLRDMAGAQSPGYLAGFAALYAHPPAWIGRAAFVLSPAVCAWLIPPARRQPQALAG